MQQTYLLFLVFCISIFACTSENSPTEETTQDEKPLDNLFVKSLTEYSPKFQRIIGKEERLFRGVSLGMTPEQIQGIEMEEKEEIEEGIVRYILDFSLEENADIEYYFSQKNELHQIDVTFYTTSQKSQDSLWNEFVDYYDFKLNKHQQNTKGIFWLYHQKDSLILQKTGNKHYRNLLLQIK